MGKRVLAISDSHCGHVTGLTPPDYQNDDQYMREMGYWDWQKWLWDYYAGLVDALRPIDVLLVIGDMVAGKEKHNRGNELLWADREVQAEMAATAINYVGAHQVFMVRGTPSHTGKGEQWENIVARHVDATIGNQLWVDVNGVVFDLKHKIGSSSTPHGRHTASARARLWNQLQALHGSQPLGTVLLRGHVHYHQDCGDPYGRAMTMPCLQGNTRYGEQECEGEVHVGVVFFEIESKEEWFWKAHTTSLRSPEATVIKA